MDEKPDNHARSDMRAFLERWLASEWNETEMDQFIRFLQNLDLPFGDTLEAAFQKLLSGLPDGRYRARDRVRLATRTAKLLENKPDQIRPGKYPDEVLSNLLKLCAGLRCPDELAEPLWKMYQRRALHGKWQGLDVRWALRAALAFNQIDRRLESDWFVLVDTGRHDFLGGGVQQGIEGLLWMPPARGQGGLAIDAIQNALRTANEKNDNVGQLVAMCKRFHPSFIQWEDLLLDDAPVVSPPLDDRRTDIDRGFATSSELPVTMLNMYGLLPSADLLNDMTSDEHEMLQTRPHTRRRD